MSCQPLFQQDDIMQGNYIGFHSFLYGEESNRKSERESIKSVFRVMFLVVSLASANVNADRSENVASKHNDNASKTNTQHRLDVHWMTQHRNV